MKSRLKLFNLINTQYALRARVLNLINTPARLLNSILNNSWTKHARRNIIHRE